MSYEVKETFNGGGTNHIGPYPNLVAAFEDAKRRLEGCVTQQSARIYNVLTPDKFIHLHKELKTGRLIID